MRLLLGRADKLQRHDADMRAAPACGRSPAASAQDRLAVRRLLGVRARAAAARGRPQRHAAARRAADLGQQTLRLGRGRGVQQIGQHGAAAVIGLDRHAALAARGMRPHQRPPGALMRPVDLQQAAAPPEIAASGSTCSRSSASATVRARSRSRSRSVVSQASKVGSIPSRSSSRSPSSSESEAGWAWSPA